MPARPFLARRVPLRACTPGLFGVGCSANADCAASLVCLPSVFDTTPFCTAQCQSDGDCTTDPRTAGASFCAASVCSPVWRTDESARATRSVLRACAPKQFPSKPRFALVRDRRAGCKNTAAPIFGIGLQESRMLPRLSGSRPRRDLGPGALASYLKGAGRIHPAVLASVQAETKRPALTRRLPARRRGRTRRTAAHSRTMRLRRDSSLTSAAERLQAPADVLTEWRRDLRLDSPTSAP
jgi:hypothetical protein